MASSTIIAVGYLLYLVLLIIVCSARNYRVTKAWYFFLFFFVLLLANMAYHLVPNRRLDLYRLQQIVEEMRGSRNSVVSLIFEGVGNQYKGLITFNCLCYIVSLLGNQWLATLSVLITCTLLFYVIVSFLASKKYSCRALLPAICMTFMGLQIQYIFSGIRNGIAVSMTIYALYQMYRHKKILISSIVIYILAIMMHPAVLIVAPVLCIAVYGKYQKLFRVVALCAIPIIFAVAYVFTTIPNALLQYIGNRVFFYENQNYAADRPELIANILMFIVVGMSYGWLNRENYVAPKSKIEVIYTDFYYLLGFVMVGCVIKRDFVNRMGYIMGILSIPLICKIFWEIKRGILRKNIKVIWLALIVSMSACCGKVFYDTLWVLSQWTFK